MKVISFLYGFSTFVFDLGSQRYVTRTIEELTLSTKLSIECFVLTNHLHLDYTLGLA